MAYNIASDIYKTIFSTLQASSDLSYITTFQSRFYPVRREMEFAELYPYLFLSFGEMGQETLHSMPNLHHYSAIISVVAMTWNKGDVNVQTAVNVSTVVTGTNYKIVSIGDLDLTGTTSWESIGADSTATVGETFEASANGPSGTTATILNMDDLVVDAGYTDASSKGILEIVEDVKKVIFTAHKSDRFGYTTEAKRDEMTADVDWTFSTVGNPDITSLQPLLLSPYIEAKQLNIALSIVEGRLTS